MSTLESGTADAAMDAAGRRSWRGIAALERSCGMLVVLGLALLGAAFPWAA